MSGNENSYKSLAEEFQGVTDEILRKHFPEFFNPNMVENPASKEPVIGEPYNPADRPAQVIGNQADHQKFEALQKNLHDKAVRLYAHLALGKLGVNLGPQVPDRYTNPKSTSPDTLIDTKNDVFESLDALASHYVGYNMKNLEKIPDDQVIAITREVSDAAEKAAEQLLPKSRSVDSLARRG